MLRLAIAPLACVLVLGGFAAAEGADPVPSGRPKPGTSTARDLEYLFTGTYVPKESATYEPPGETERTQFKRAFVRLLEEAQGRTIPWKGEPGPSRQVAEDFARLGFRITPVCLPDDPIWMIHRVEGREQVAEAFAMRVGPDAGPRKPSSPAGRPASRRAGTVERVAVLCPHPRSDKYTEILGIRLFTSSRSRTFYQATARRKLLDPGGVPYDTTHRTDSFFQAATDALDSVWQDGLFIQLHGFDPRKHPEIPAGQEAVLADGTGRSEPGKQVAGALTFLRARHGSHFLGFVTSAAGLAATRNAQARLINARAKNAFLQVEMSFKLRDALTSNLPTEGDNGHLLLDSLAHLIGR
ncbi:MAG: hypothetical protein HY815_02000 [Candidatus Riflebacteria bacterium]|nr:hypothetical protein [Candidatus Riflebacteria bacterium]